MCVYYIVYGLVYYSQDLSKLGYVFTVYLSSKQFCNDFVVINKTKVKVWQKDLLVNQVNVAQLIQPVTWKAVVMGSNPTEYKIFAFCLPVVLVIFIYYSQYVMI